MRCICTHIFTSCTHVYTHPIFSTRINGHMLKLHRQTHTCTDTHTMKNINLQRYIYTQCYTQLTLTMCTNMNLQGYMYTHHTHTTHIDEVYTHHTHPQILFWAARRRPYIVFTFTGSVRNVRNDVNIYIYIYMSTTW